MNLHGKPQIAFVLTPDDRRIDQKKTKKEFFGHPTAEGDGTYADRAPVERFLPSSAFHWVSSTFASTNYMETFFSQALGDFEGKRKNEPTLDKTLGVFHREDGHTRQVCEYRMTTVQ